MSERAQDPSELFDVLSADGRNTGITRKRADVHRDGDWHAALHIWIYGLEQDEPFLMFQRRGRFKDTKPRKLDATVGGHVRAGETIEESLREVTEEIGRSVTMPELRFLGVRIGINEEEPGIVDRELQYVYLWRLDDSLAMFTPNTDELESLIRLPLDDVLAIFGEGIVAADGIELKAGSAILTPVLVTRSEFVSGIDRYPFRVAIAVHNALRGDRYIAI